MEAFHLGQSPLGPPLGFLASPHLPLAPPFLTETLPVHPLARLCPQLGMASASPRPCLDHSLLCIPSSPGSLHLLTSNHPLSPAWSGCDAGTLLDNLINLEEEDQLHGPLRGPLASVATSRQTSPHCGHEHRPGLLLPSPYPMTLCCRHCPPPPQEGCPILASGTSLVDQSSHNILIAALGPACCCVVPLLPSSSWASEPNPLAWLSPLPRPGEHPRCDRAAFLASSPLCYFCLQCMLLLAKVPKLEIRQREVRVSSAVHGPPTLLHYLG